MFWIIYRHNILYMYRFFIHLFLMIVLYVYKKVIYQTKYTSIFFIYCNIHRRSFTENNIEYEKFSLDNWFVYHLYFSICFFELIDSVWFVYDSCKIDILPHFRQILGTICDWLSCQFPYRYVIYLLWFVSGWHDLCRFPFFLHHCN